MFPFIAITDDIVIPTYFLMFSFTYTLCLIWGFYRAANYSLSQKTFLDLALVVMFGGFIGSRLFHVIYEHPDYYLHDPTQIFRFWLGGFVFYGGVLGAAVPGYFFLRHRNEDIRLWLNFLTPILALGYILGRLATLLSGSGFGRPTSMSWAIIYPPNPEAPPGVSLHPTPIYAMLWTGVFLIAFLIFDHHYKKTLAPGNEATRSRLLSYIDSHVFYLFVFWHSLGRLIIEQYRSDYRGGAPLGLSISSWISLLLIFWTAWRLYGLSTTARTSKASTR